MYKPVGINKFTYINKQKPKIPTSVIVLFFVLNFGFGMDFGFIKLFSSKYRKVVKFVSLSTSIITAIILVPQFKQQKSIGISVWYLIVLLQYTLYFFVLQFTKYSVYDFMTDIHNINEEDNVTAIKKQRLGVISSIYALVLISLKVTIFVVYCTKNGLDCSSYFVPCYVIVVKSHCVEVIPIVQLVLYYYIYCCVKYLKLSLKSTEVNTVLKRYVALTESFDKIKPFYDILVISQLFFKTPTIMTTLYDMLLFIKMNYPWFEFINECSYWAPFFIHICAPAVIAEVVKSQIGGIKVILHKKLVMEEDAKKIFELKRMLRYVKARGLQHKAWGLVPVDLRLPVSLLSIYITYLIVLLQFTHLYD